MEQYLNQLSKHIFQKYGNDFSKICLVFPNRRAGLFFQYYLADCIEKPLWSPQILTIKDFVSSFSKLSSADNLKLLHELFKVYRLHFKNIDHFDDFIAWGEMMLYDFDEIDKYMVNVEELFQNISDLKEIDHQFNYLSAEQIEAISAFWRTFAKTHQSQNQKKFLDIWKLLFKIYTDFKKVLASKNIAYEGMIYREVAENIKINNSTDYDKILFIGFNALNSAEETIFEYFNSQEKAEFYWDYDQFYLAPKVHEAGKFLRRNMLKFPETKIDVNTQNFKTEKNINIVAAPSDIAQCNILNTILKEISGTSTSLGDQQGVEKFNFSKTAIVLADENLLIPVLYSIPNNYEDVNITMGYSLKNTPVYSFIENVIELSRNAISKDGVNSFYFNDLANIFSHSYTKYFDTNVYEILAEISANNETFVNSAKTEKLNFFKNSELLFSNTFDLIDFIQSKIIYLHNIFSELENVKNYDVEREFLYYTYLEIKKLRDVIQTENLNIRKETFLSFLRKILKLVKIPFSGEPLSGLQILGVLETRLLDFENLIILSLNEGNFPAGGSSNSFIPYNLRKGFGIPTIEYTDAMFSYYFYRMIQRSKNVYLLYNTERTLDAKGEMSRYLYQLKYEAPFEINFQNLTLDIDFQEAKPVSIDKNLHREKLEEYFTSEKYLSPSSLNTYLTCSLQFFYRHILRIKEPASVSEEIGFDVFGNIFHLSMQKIYSEFKDKIVSKEDIDKLLNNKQLTDEIVLSSFQKEYSENNEKPSGNNIIIIETIKKYIHQVLNFDKQKVPFTVLETEKSFQTLVDVVYSIENKQIKIGGNIDRIDQIENSIHLIDYKTGKAKLDFKQIEDLFSADAKLRNNAVFQLILYSYLYEKNSLTNSNIIPNVYAIKELYNTNCETNLKIGKDAFSYLAIENEFEQRLKNLLNKIFNLSINFTQTEDKENCKNCLYCSVCHREI